MTAKLVWHWQQVRTLREMAADGFTRAEVADELGVTLDSLRRLIRREGVRFRRGGRPDPALWSRLASLVEMGVDTAGRIAGEVGRSKEAVSCMSNRMIAAGILRRTGAGRGRRLHLTASYRDPSEESKKRMERAGRKETV